MIDKKGYPNVSCAMDYAQKVVRGEVVACKYIVGSCKRFLKDLKDSERSDSKYIFDINYVERYLRLVQKFEHYIGSWNTPEIVYEDWQKWVWANALGFKHRDNPRRPRYRTIHLEVPRGCAKSTQASQCALYFIGLDPVRKGEKIAVFATKNEQARIILDGSRAMAKKSEKYLKASGVEVLAHKIVDPKNFSEMVAMSADSKSMDGLNLRIAFCDELHAMTRELFEVIVSGMKKRPDSLVICCTTAGFNTDGVGYSQSQYAKKVAIGEVEDDTFFSAVYTIDDGDDIFEESTWRKANPNYGVSVDPVSFEAAAKKAKVTPSDITNFKTKNLNIWTSEANAFFDLRNWDDLYDPTLTFEKMQNDKCYVGLDLASKVDLTCQLYLFYKDGVYYALDRTYVPEKTADDLRNSLYDESIEKGFLIKTPGEAIHYPRIEQDILELSKKFNTLAIHYDPWNATQIAQRLSEERVNMVEFRMNTANLSEPTKLLDALIKQKKFRHNGSPLLKWCLSNVVCKEDAAGNVFPRKSHERLKIDMAVALIMALAGWIQDKHKDSVYSERGIIII